MKTALVLFSLFLLSSPALASPWLTCDPYPTGPGQPDQFTVILDGGVPIISPAEVMPDGKRRLMFDLAGIATGAHIVSVAAGVSLWGLESAALPFAFSKPAAPKSPAAFGLVR